MPGRTGLVGKPNHWIGTRRKRRRRAGAAEGRHPRTGPREKRCGGSRIASLVSLSRDPTAKRRPLRSPWRLGARAPFRAAPACGPGPPRTESGGSEGWRASPVARSSSRAAHGGRAVLPCSSGSGFVQHRSRALDKQRVPAGTRRSWPGGRPGGCATARGEPACLAGGLDRPCRAGSVASLPIRFGRVPAGSALSCPRRAGPVASLPDRPGRVPAGPAQSRAFFPLAVTAYHSSPNPSTSFPLTSPASVSLAK